jgi:hypothetical protein
MRRDWERHRQRDRMRTHGAESARGEAHLLLPLLPARAPQPRVSKAELRAQAHAALVDWKTRQHNALTLRRRFTNVRKEAEND